MSGSNLIALNVKCPKCGQDHAPRGKAMTLTMVCTKCKAYFRIGSWNKDITKFEFEYEPIIPIGAKGKIDDVVYEVMGCVVKKEQKYKYTWREYLLFNPYQGFAFLAEYDGHWNFITPVENDPRKDTVDDSFEYESRKYQLYSKYRAEVIAARGEFFSDVVDETDSTLNYEYISPPHILAYETSADSMIWFEGVYVLPEEVAKEFKIPKEKFPEKEGLGYTEPVVGSFSKEGVLTLSVILGLIALVIQIFISVTSKEETVFSKRYYPNEFTLGKMVSTESFQMEGDLKNVEIQVISPLSNNWLYADFTLVNENDGSEYDFSKEIEYYSGYDDGYSWSEGSQAGWAHLSKIPGGKYHINIYPQSSDPAAEIGILVTRDVSDLTNFFLVILALAIFPTISIMWRSYKERKRWEDSDYSPYHFD